jgi:uncharacterized coiled-coil protein SlyX
MNLSLENKKIFEERLVSLPVEIQTALTDGTIEQLGASITETFPLSDSDRVKIENELVLVFMGFESLDGFSDRIQETTAIVDTVAQAIEESLQEQFANFEVPSTPKESPILQATRTMQGDVAEAQGDSPQWRTLEEDEGPQEASGIESTTESGDVPRYAKPLTDTPKYE